MTEEHAQKSAPDAAAEAKEKAKPKGPFVAAAKVVKHVQLAEVHFIACSAQATADADVASSAKLSAATSFLKPLVTPLEHGFSAKTSLLFEVKQSGSESEPAQPPFGIVRATIEAKYTVRPDSPAFTDEELQDYALCYGPFHVWGYWREFVQSSLARLDLPQLTVPLFLIAQAPSMVQDKID